MPVNNCSWAGGRKVDQQALGNPRGWLGRIKASVPQCLWPIITQIDLDLATLGVRCRAVRRKHLTLESQDLRLVQLEDRRPVRPRQPIRPHTDSIALSCTQPLVQS